MLFAFIHELGHLLAGLLMGFKPKSLEVAPYGFSISFEGYSKGMAKEKTWALKRIFIAFAGPLTNLLIILAIYLYLFIVKDINAYYVELIIYSNILIFIFNMLPIYPLDGGRIIKEIINIIYGTEKSYTYTYKISKGCVIILTIVASLGVLIYKNIAIPIIIIYLWFVLIKERKYIKVLYNN